MLACWLLQETSSRELVEILLNESKEAQNHSLLNSSSVVPMRSDVTDNKQGFVFIGKKRSIGTWYSIAITLSAPLFSKKVNKHDEEKTDSNQTPGGQIDLDAGNTEKLNNAGNMNSVGQVKITEVLKYNLYVSQIHF
ncbi:hypothetical protein GH714_020207 [Hevea brasiliensis]|uniref:Uncharacterized protein n=1 Tax=Hevea brasiliensis TaxID=3981 RepID=A0A6A6K4B3_HEVBR|nr:hypothetical protein GH714_043243 [Hevea brasiliensis]KAF2294815.1 hypothetical protein GH714_020207 [Hevea brasiliensis]